MTKIFLALTVFTTLAFAQVAPSLTAVFQGHSKKTNHSYRITQGENGYWKLEDIAPCPSYPCSPQDFTEVSILLPELISDARIADGNTEIKLSNFYKITFINNGMVPPKADGTREESYWKLSITKNDSAQEDVKLYLQALVKTH